MSVRNKTKIITKYYKLLPIITNYYYLLPIITKIIDLRTVVAGFYLLFYVRFPQIFWDWKADSADFYTFRMYGTSVKYNI